jgi:hypothetical protein
MCCIGVENIVCHRDLILSWSSTKSSKASSYINLQLCIGITTKDIGKSLYHLMNMLYSASADFGNSWTLTQVRELSSLSDESTTASGE